MGAKSKVQRKTSPCFIARMTRDPASILWSLSDRNVVKAVGKEYSMNNDKHPNYKRPRPPKPPDTENENPPPPPPPRNDDDPSMLNAFDEGNNDGWEYPPFDDLESFDRE
jgi:hypothetical protein